MENLLVRFPPNSLVVNTPASSIRAGLRGQRICSSKGVKHLVEANPNMVTIPSQYVLPASFRPSLFPDEAAIPLIDLQELNEPPACWEMVVSSIGTGCSEWGFFRASSIYYLLFISLLYINFVCLLWEIAKLFQL